MKSSSQKEPEHWAPKPYQERALGMMMEQAAVGLFLDPGLGKTSTCLAAFSLLKELGLVNRMLIVAPLRVCYSVWPREIEKWTEFSHLRVSIIHGTPAQREKAIDCEADVYLINFEGVAWLLDDTTRRFERVGADVLCVDESSKFKSPSSQRFKALKSRVSAFKRRWILTGTPTPNGIMDLFSQIFILDGGRALGRYITHFRNKWFYQTGFGGYTWEPRPGAYDDIVERVRPLSLRLSAEDNLDLPELRVGGGWDIYVDLPRSAMDLYRTVESDFITTLGGTTIVAMNAAAAGTKVRQIANGAVYTTDLDENLVPISSGKWEEVHSEKISAIESLVEELGGAPLLVFYEFDHDRQRLQDKFDWPCLTGLSPEKGDRLLADFNAGRIPVLLAHPQSAGHGLNIQEFCHHVCWFGLTWNLENYQQAIARVHRQGQKNIVTVYRIIARGTKDEDVAKALLDKAVTQETILKMIAAND